MSALNPDQESCPEAISGGWKAGLPWHVRHVSDWSNWSSSCQRERESSLVVKGSWNNYRRYPGSYWVKMTINYS